MKVEREHRQDGVILPSNGPGAISYDRGTLSGARGIRRPPRGPQAEDLGTLHA